MTQSVPSLCVKLLGFTIKDYTLYTRTVPVVTETDLLRMGEKRQSRSRGPITTRRLGSMKSDVTNGLETFSKT